MKNRVFVTGILIIILIGSGYFLFQDSSSLRKDLLHIEQLLFTDSDSALTLLQKIKYPEKLSEENQALYALLMMRATYKYNLPVTSDSLIRTAVDYYKNGNDSIRKGWSYLYYGKYYQDNNDKKKALEYYQKASLAALNTNEYKLNELLYNYWGLLLLKEKPYDDGINKLKKSLEYAKLRNDSLSQGFILRNLGLSYMWKEDWEEALKIHEEGIKIAEIFQNPSLLSSFYNNISIIYWRRKEFPLAMQYINKSLSFNQEFIDSLASQSMKGLLFFETGQYDSARYYIEKRGLGKTLYSKAYYYDALSLLEEKLGHYKKALEYRNQYANYLDSIRNSEKNSELIVLQRKYDYSMVQNENNRLKLAQQKDEFTLLITIFIAIVVTLFYWGYYYKKKKEKETLIQIKDDLLKQSVIELQKKTVQLQKQQEELYSQKEILTLHQQKEQGLKSRILKMDTIIQKIESLNTYNEIKQNRSIAELALSQKEFDDLEETVNLCYDNFATRLRKDFPKLKEDDIHLCCLIKIKVSNKNIISLLNTNNIALKKRRYRIKHDRMELSDEVESLDQFLSTY